jgi:uncharacterized protein YhhL (DUF1145 family)
MLFGSLFLICFHHEVALIPLKKQLKLSIKCIFDLLIFTHRLQILSLQSVVICFHHEVALIPLKKQLKLSIKCIFDLLIFTTRAGAPP